MKINKKYDKIGKIMEENNNEKEPSVLKKVFSNGFGTIVVVSISAISPAYATVSNCVGPCGYGPNT